MDVLLLPAGVWVGAEKGVRGWSNLSWQIDRLASAAVLSYEIVGLCRTEKGH